MPPRTHPSAPPDEPRVFYRPRAVGVVVALPVLSMFAAGWLQVSGAHGVMEWKLDLHPAFEAEPGRLFDLLGQTLEVSLLSRSGGSSRGQAVLASVDMDRDGESTGYLMTLLGTGELTTVGV